MQLSIVSYLDSAAIDNVRQLQQTLSEITGSRVALDSWQPHITLGDGIDIPHSALADFVDDMKRALQSTAIFNVTISGISSLDSRPTGIGEISTPYVIFINVSVNQELTNLVARIDTLINGRSIWYHMPRPYLPHVTLAFRDLSEAGYRSGLDYLQGKTVRLTSKIDHIALVERRRDTDAELTRIKLV
jgi:2'-5' RNA ligase